MKKGSVAFLLIVNLISFIIKTEAQTPYIQRSWNYVATKMPEEWYGSEESLKVAENVILYQRDIGGWPKNTPIHIPLTEVEKAKVYDDKGNNDAIFDNGATTTEMKFLVKMFLKTNDLSYKTSFNSGLKFILDAQYENGGWPMFYPVRKGYYSHITFNDNAMVNILKLLGHIIQRDDKYGKITLPELVARSEVAYNKGIECILKTQIRSKGVLTVWCAQHDEISFLPAKARSYELPSFSGAESAAIIDLLMDIRDPSPAIIESIQNAIKWLDGHRIKKSRWEPFTNKEGLPDRRIVIDPKAGDMWARFYDLDSELPYVCDRDGVKKATVEEIGYERRNAYNWYTTDPKEVIDKYPAWKAKWVK